MNRTRIKAALILSAIASLIALTVPGMASAHGYISSPPSRQAQCAAGTVPCGAIQYEPQSVEGPKGLRSCSGGNGRFAELDDDSKNWAVTPVGSTTSFTWHLTARHATSTWQYYIGGTKIAECNDGGAQPGATVTHQVNFGGFSGEQKVLAVWNIADTANAFYACVDVNIGGGGDGDCTSSAWDAGAVYRGGDLVAHAGVEYRAKWWTQGDEPGTTGEWGVWEVVQNC